MSGMVSSFYWWDVALSAALRWFDMDGRKRRVTHNPATDLWEVEAA